jgi:hypothetical protein
MAGMTTVTIAGVYTVALENAPDVYSPMNSPSKQSGLYIRSQHSCTACKIVLLTSMSSDGVGSGWRLEMSCWCVISDVADVVVLPELPAVGPNTKAAEHRCSARTVLASMIADQAKPVPPKPQSAQAT